MNPISQPWIPVDRIAAVVQLEPALVTLGLAIGSWIVYKIFLREISELRHQNLRRLFVNLFFHTLLASTFFAAFWILHQLTPTAAAVERVVPYLGLAALISGLIVFIKTFRVIVFEYLFLGHMKVGVPLLLVNICTLIVMVILGGWVAADVFGIRLMPLLATSAIFSIILGLALQDTLGNLFAGVALQLDKPYSIGDWIEVHANGQKWVGQVLEITWRSTVLTALLNELITIPNRTMAQANISNFTLKSGLFCRLQIFRFSFDVPTQKAKEILVKAAKSVPMLRGEPQPFAYLAETNESWVTYKLFYYLDDYNAQFNITDLVIAAVMKELEKNGISLATNKLEVAGQLKSESSPFPRTPPPTPPGR